MGQGAQGEETSAGQTEGAEDRGGKYTGRRQKRHIRQQLMSKDDNSVSWHPKALRCVCQLQSDDNDPSGEEEFSGSGLDPQVRVCVCFSGVSGAACKTPPITCVLVFVYRPSDTWVPGMTAAFALFDFPLFLHPVSVISVTAVSLTSAHLLRLDISCNDCTQAGETKDFKKVQYTELIPRPRPFVFLIPPRCLLLRVCV